MQILHSYIQTSNVNQLLINYLQGIIKQCVDLDVLPHFISKEVGMRIRRLSYSSYNKDSSSTNMGIYRIHVHEQISLMQINEHFVQAFI